MASQRFIDFMLEQGVLKFGEFTLNSGRISPYFFNLGEVSSGAAYARLGLSLIHISEPTRPY